MSLTDLTEKILADAKARAEGITNDAKARAQAIQQETSEKLVEKRSIFQDSLERILADNSRQVQASARQEVKLMQETAKRALVNKVFDEALSQLRESRSDVYVSHMASLMATLPAETAGKVRAPENRVAEISEALKRSGLSLPISPDPALTSGCIIEGTDFEVDLTLEKVIAERRVALEVQVAAILFPVS
jgi:vacuolar-type H+-ATPase subunit E/Vma4